MTFCPEWLTGNPNLDTSNPLYFWVYLMVCTLIRFCVILNLTVAVYTVQLMNIMSVIIFFIATRISANNFMQLGCYSHLAYV